MTNDTNIMQINCNYCKSYKRADLMNLTNNARKLLKSQAKPLKNVDLADSEDDNKGRGDKVITKVITYKKRTM